MPSKSSCKLRGRPGLEQLAAVWRQGRVDRKVFLGKFPVKIDCNQSGPGPQSMACPGEGITRWCGLACGPQCCFGAGEMATLTTTKTSAPTSWPGWVSRWKVEGLRLRSRNAEAPPFPSSPVGEGGRDAKYRGRVRGSATTDRDPSSDPRFARITFSHKGRREEKAFAYNCPSSVSPPETSTLPGAGSLLIFLTTPSSTSIE
jgi:hypothetical protein